MFVSSTFKTNFNTVLTREKLKKEQIINDLSEKLQKVTQQQEKDKGEYCALHMAGVGKCAFCVLQ